MTPEESTQRRNRGIVLSFQGEQKLRETISLLESEEKFGQKFTLEELSDRTGLDPGTVAKVLGCEQGVDRRTLDRCFRTFELKLTESDYCKLEARQARPETPRNPEVQAPDVEVRPKSEELDRIIKDTFRIGDKIVDGPELVRIPAGNYLISREEDRTRLQVIDEFAIGRFPVTFRQYDLFCEASKYEMSNDMGWGREDRPVINVSFLDAMKYIEWLCERTGKEYRLPTAVEWEYAARAGTNSAYWWGNEIKRNNEFMANCNGCGSPWDEKRMTSPVDQFPSNDWGLYDTAGNVWEWTCTRDDGTEGGVPLDKFSRVIIKGGAWYDKPDRLRCSIRESFYIDEKSNTIGFRVSYSLPSPR
ncbi:SUMF1/EgtB/PvdO family nonheme iron enzyme [Phormidium tenue FACHB-886]|nr:SUMF1/EgtB/PvdO family nonheme iron enzyme [Phormidium tenue FACHB-886]